ncbi:MAG TPA: SHOCT domain-containing protein [Streptosporangiaceae bacterium]|nr:SHOCT domain-containing protein [Streptosporangiaceae bacterium]
MPRVSPGMLYRGTPDLLVGYGVRYSIGWQDHRRPGPSFVVARLRWSGTRVKARFPLTEQGWESAWRELRRVDASAAAAVADKLAAQAVRDSAAAARVALDHGSLCSLRSMSFKGGSGGGPLAEDQAYELRFLGDRITVTMPGRLDALITVPYRDVDAVEVSGPGKVTKPLGDVLVWVLGLGLLGAVLGLLVLGVVGLLLGAVLFGLIGAMAGSASTRVETIVRIRRPEADLYFLSKEKEPDALRIELSAALAAIEAARGAPSDHAEAPAESSSGSIPDQLGKLASLLQDGTITHDEFEHLKARLISSV